MRSLPAGIILLIAPALAFAEQAAQAPPTQQAPALAAQPAPRPPIVNRVNEVLPAWLRVRSELRERIEGFDGGGFNPEREDLYYLTRFRFNTTITASNAFSFQAQVQDARVGKKTVGPTGAPFSAPLDLRMAFTDVGTAKSPVTARIGRQELAYGEQRLVGHVSWANAARTFDGARITFRTSAVSVDAFAASVVRIMDGAFDKSGAGNRLAGAYATTTKVIPKATVEPYVFFRRDVNLRAETGSIGALEETTIGARLAGRLPARLDYGIEMAMQRGALGSDDVQAWAGHWQLRESLPGSAAIRLTGEYNYASGDKDPADGIRGTFDQLYPTPHDKYGLADQFGWKNIHHLRGGFEFTPIKTTSIAANYHSWWLAEARDGIYTAASAPLARVTTGAADRHVGQEIDLQVARPLTPQMQFAAGYAHIFTGGFLEHTTPGASYSYPYVMVTYVFLAEK